MNKPQSLSNLSNRTYYLCIEDRYAATVINEWMHNYKTPPLSFRDARKGVEGSFILAVKDEGGNHLKFINRLAEITRAKVAVR